MTDPIGHWIDLVGPKHLQFTSDDSSELGMIGFDFSQELPELHRRQKIYWKIVPLIEQGAIRIPDPVEAWQAIEWRHLPCIHNHAEPPADDTDLAALIQQLDELCQDLISPYLCQDRYDRLTLICLDLFIKDDKTVNGFAQTIMAQLARNHVLTPHYYRHLKKYYGIAGRFAADESGLSAHWWRNAISHSEDGDRID